MTLLSILGIGGRAAGHTQIDLRTGASVQLAAQHRDRLSGEIHAHKWTLTAWVRSGGDARHLKAGLSEWASQYEGKCLPDRIAWGEDMAVAVVQFLRGEGWEDVLSVSVAREEEGLFAEYQP